MNENTVGDRSEVLPPLFYVDRADRGRLRLTGRDRQSFLQGMVTNDVASLTPGGGCYAFLTDATAHVLSDARILCADGYLLLDVEPGLAPAVAQTLERYLIMEKCRIANATDTLSQRMIGGVGASAFLESLGISDANTWIEGANAPTNAFVTTGQDNPATLVARTALLTVPTFDLYLPREGGAVAALAAALAQAGAVALAADTLERFRIEAGIPRFGVDIDARVLAPETGQAHRAIHRRKGCYIGQEVIARIDARGHTNRAFAGLRLAGGGAPAPGTPIEADAREVGRTTSSTISPTLGVPIALGYVRNDVAQAADPITIAGVAAQVVALPFGTA